MVVLLTYFSLILGELVPKRLALTHPEAIASLIARPMDILATVGRPIVRLLSLSTDGILRLFGVRQTNQPGVTVDEIRVMLKTRRCGRGVRAHRARNGQQRAQSR
jgi:putative hemolysin